MVNGELMETIKVIHGPNLNLLGEREPEIYGLHNLEEINQKIADYGSEIGVDLSFFQSNHEGEIIDFIQKDYKNTAGLVINPAGLTHYSISLRDAIVAVELPTVEVHLSNIYSREEIRTSSVISPVVEGVISGLGYQGYLYAVNALLKIIKEEK